MTSGVVILKGKVRRTHMQMLISRKTVGPFIVSKGGCGGPEDPLKVVINGSPDWVVG